MGIDVGPAPGSLCCYIDQGTGVHCQKLSEWIVYDGPRHDDYTVACTVHLGYLLSDADEFRVYPLRGHLDAP